MIPLGLTKEQKFICKEVRKYNRQVIIQKGNSMNFNIWAPMTLTVSQLNGLLLKIMEVAPTANYYVYTHYPSIYNGKSLYLFALCVK